MNIIKAPSLSQIQAVVEWLSQCPHPNLDLEYVLSLILMGQLAQNQGELLAIAHTSSTPEALKSHEISGALMAGPGNRNVSLVGCDRATAELLLSLVQARSCPQRIATSIPSRDWIRPLLLQRYQLEREHNSLIMKCTKAPFGGYGRWAVPDDKPTLQDYIEANQAERGGRIARHDWDTLIQQKRVAVLEHNGQIVSVVKHGETLQHGMITGVFTFAPFRRQGFAKQLLIFVLCEMLKEHNAVKLWVDDDNWSALTLYKSLGFEAISALYTGYFDEAEKLKSEL